jgi:hypothetical protein
MGAERLSKVESDEREGEIALTSVNRTSLPG